MCRKCENTHQKRTVNKKYGVDNISQIPEVKNKIMKIREKLLEFYGSQNNELNIKRQMNKTTELQNQNFKEIRIEEHKRRFFC